ncbi:MAG: ribonuclease HI [Alphaproteobacteria bacterium]|nr:MAG: ribonuclease HI [Alphaproteobacteria bacterium]
MKGPFKIYTDGACSGNPGQGGWGAFIIDAMNKEFQLSGYEERTTNNRMELMGVIEALSSMPAEGEKIAIYTDSQYVKNGITVWIHGWIKNGWKTAGRQPVKNQDLWAKLHDLTNVHEVDWNWVRGHAGDFGNERADALARSAIVRLRI